LPAGKNFTPKRLKVLKYHRPLFTSGTRFSNQSIIDGTHDTYLRTYADAVKLFGKPLFIRFGHEMNGNWYSWDGTHSGGSTTTGYGDQSKADGPERYVDAYRYVWEVFESRSVTNVTWIWCPNADNVPGQAWNDMLNYYPGDEYVDWVGIDGYNFGSAGGGWRMFSNIYTTPYNKVKGYGKPIIIGEFASGESGGDKAAWITDCFSKLKTTFPQIKAWVWFNVNKETDWRITSSTAAQTAFRQAMNDSYYIGKITVFGDLSGSTGMRGFRIVESGHVQTPSPHLLFENRRSTATLIYLLSGRTGSPGFVTGFAPAYAVLR